jgi:hypothetical protein
MVIFSEDYGNIKKKSLVVTGNNIEDHGNYWEHFEEDYGKYLQKIMVP